MSKISKVFKNEKQRAAYLGLCFFFIEMSINLIYTVQNFMPSSIRNEDPEFYLNINVNVFIQFLSSSIASVFASTAINRYGSRTIFVVGGVLHLLFNVQFLYCHVVLIYFGSILRGISYSFIWTAVGRYLTENSTEDTIFRNGGIFLTILQLNKVVGNVYILLRFDEDFVKKERLEFYGVLTASCFISCILFTFLPLAFYHKPTKEKFKESIDRLGIQFTNKNNLMLLVLYAYQGIFLSFTIGVFGNCLVNTSLLRLAPIQRIAVSYICNGFGGITASAIIGLVGKKIERRDCFIAGSFFIQLINRAFIVCSFPNSCVVERTEEKGITQPRIYIAFISSYLNGFGETTVYLMTFRIFALIFKKTITEAHAMLRIIFSISAGIQYLIAPNLKVYGSIAMLFVSAFLVLLMFCLVERRYKLKQKQKRETPSLKKKTYLRKHGKRVSKSKSISILSVHSFENLENENRGIKKPMKKRFSRSSRTSDEIKQHKKQSKDHKGSDVSLSTDFSKDSEISRKRREKGKKTVTINVFPEQMEEHDELDEQKDKQLEQKEK